MKARALPLLLLAALPLASATYGAGSELEVDSPLTLEGRADTWLPGGMASYVGSGTTSPVGVLLHATEAEIVYRTEVPCASAASGIPTLPSQMCPEGAYAEEDDVLSLRDVTLTVVKATSAYKLLATTDRAYLDGAAAREDGRILVTTAGTSTLGANEEGTHLSGSPEEPGWVSDAEGVAFEPIYDAPALSSQLSSGSAVLRVTGGFETFLQGLQVQVKGIDQETGEPVERGYDTRLPSGDDPVTMLIVEAAGGDMRATASAPLTGYAPADERPITDVGNRVSVAGATGTLIEDGDERDLDGEDASLVGPLSLRLVEVADGSPIRLTYAITPGAQLVSAEDLEQDEPMDAAALAAAGAAGAGGAGALIALLYFWPRLKYALTLALLPMYTRIERDAVLEHEKRDELYELIRATPGIHAHEIGSKANIGWGTTVYHLKLLENHGLIVSKKSGRYKRFFVNTGEYTKKKDIYGALRNETAKSVADFIFQHPGTTQKEMCAALGIQPSLASWHVEKLEGVELVKRVKDGRMVRYFAGPAWQQLGTPVAPAPTSGDVEGGAAS